MLSKLKVSSIKLRVASHRVVNESSCGSMSLGLHRHFIFVKATHDVFLLFLILLFLLFNVFGLLLHLASGGTSSRFSVLLVS